MSKHRTHGSMRNRLVSGLLCLALVLGLLPAGLIQPAEAAHWADPYAQQLVDWGVMRGDISGNLNLNNPITRAEFVTMCNRAFGYDKLGTMPFTDVPSSQWYAQDINIAYNAGYFKGLSNTIAAPNASLTREQAAVLLARNLMLQETVGESLGFSDSRTLQEWSRGLIAAAVSEGMITGYSDGSFRPANPITRGEVAAMLVRVIGNPVDKSGSYELGNVYGNVTVSSSNVTLRNTTIVGNLYLTGGIDLGNVLLENVTVLGRIVVSGAGESNMGQESVVLRNVVADELVVDSLQQQFVTIRAQGVTDIPITNVRSDAYLDDSSESGYGLHRIELVGESGTKLQLAGSIKEVVNKTPSSDLQLVKGSAEKVTIDELARNSQVLVDEGTRMDELNLDVATLVTGKGDIKDLNVGAAGSEVDILPDTVVIRPGITATINGEEMGSVDASELSSEPRLMAGYPTVVNIAPTEAQAQLSGNKPGTIYWAISSIADGSVSEEDLINNPVYGGNIYEEQAGSIDAANAKAVYVQQITELQPDGSYYISAIMVDGRGKRSPLKVAAFTTPDNTKPDFVSKTTEPNTGGKYAYMTKVTTTVAQVTAAANKNCLLYWALLPEGAAAPTPQEFKTGSLGGNFGYGSLNMAKNVPTSITVNRSRLQEKTTYELYLWLTDVNGAQSMDTPLRITFSTPDETPPVVTAPVQTGWYENKADATFSMNEAPATLYWAIVAEGNESFIAPGSTPEETAEIMADLRNKIKVEAGTGAISSGSAPVTTAYADVLFTITGLDTAVTKTNNYTLYYVGKDAAGNYSERVGSVSIQTLDTTPPTVEQQFTIYNGDKTDQPLADTGVKLVFSEQVKGGANAAKTFLELYNDAVDPSVSAETRKEAQERLAKELSDHIKLYQVPRTGQPVILNPALGYDDTDPEAVLDFRNAIVSFENGNLVVFLPGEGDSEATAIRLDSGATYYFQLLSVFDNAFIPNGVSNSGTANPQGNLRLDNFTTVYAQVNIEWNTGVTKIEKTGDTYDGVRLDVVVDVKPTSTSKVPDTECWDMIVWSDTWVGVKIYYIELDENGAEVGNWQCLNPNAVAVAASATSPGISLGASVRTGSVSNRYQTITTTLLEGHTYRYGFHITEVRGISESGETDDADSWGDLVTMRFGLIAGASGGVQVVSGNVGGNFDSNYEIRRPDLASYISSANSSTGTTNILTVPKQFIDTRAPEFNGDYPHFTTGSSTITMDVQLTRPGTIYYVAAPVGEISLSYMDGSSPVVINSNNDGSQLTGSAAPTGLTYIPEDGSGRITYEKNIYYMTGIDGKKTYVNPSYGFITDAKTFYDDNELVFVPNSPASYTSSTVHEEMTGLQPDTWYYIFVVLEGGGAPDQVVQVYRQKTEPVVKPEINVRGTSDTAYVTPSEDAEITFALVELNALPVDIFGSYYKPGTTTVDTTSIIYQMINTVGQGSYKSLFDESTDAQKKLDVYNYISGEVRPTTSVQPVLTQKLFGGEIFNGVTFNGVSKETQVELELSRYMTSPNSEYVLLVMGRHPYGGTNPAEDYSFGAINSLFTPDKEPPVLETVGTTGVYVAASIRTVYKADGTAATDQDWRTNPFNYTYSGTVTVTFDKNIYVLDNSVRYGLYYNLPTGVTNGKKLVDLIGGSAKVGTTSTSQSQIGVSFTLSFDKIGAYETIVLFANGTICNGSSYDTSVITLTFDPSITTYDLGSTTIQGAAMTVGGFRVTSK